MHIEVIQTDNHPSGAGGRPLVAPAIAAAVAELTGVLRHTPFLPGAGQEGARSEPSALAVGGKGRALERGDWVKGLLERGNISPLTSIIPPQAGRWVMA